MQAKLLFSGTNCNSLQIKFQLNVSCETLISHKVYVDRADVPLGFFVYKLLRFWINQFFYWISSNLQLTVLNYSLIAADESQSNF